MTQRELSVAFNPGDPGTPEAQWRLLLRGVREWAPDHGPLIVVAPHPDDEVLGAGGLMQTWAVAGLPIRVLSVTDGEAADPGRRDLHLIRRRELRDALRALTPTHIDILHLALPDGKVCEHVNRLRSAIEQQATPGTTLIAPYEHDGHPDHDVVGRICGEVARASGVALARYPVWTWHHTKPVTVQSLPWARFSLSAAARRAKARALQCFSSQLRPSTGPPIVPQHVLAHFHRPYEAFVL